MTDDDLAAAFAVAGTVTSAKVVMDRDTNRSKGFGFVEMSTDDEAAAAIKQLDGQDVGGRTIVVREARPMAERGERKPYGGGGGNGGGDSNRRSW